MCERLVNVQTLYSTHNTIDAIVSGAQGIRRNRFHLIVSIYYESLVSRQLGINLCESKERLILSWIARVCTIHHGPFTCTRCTGRRRRPALFSTTQTYFVCNRENNAILLGSYFIYSNKYNRHTFAFTFFCSPRRQLVLERRRGRCHIYSVGLDTISRWRLDPWHWWQMETACTSEQLRYKTIWNRSIK